MTSFHPGLTAAVAHEHRRDLMRAAAQARLVAAARDDGHDRTARSRPAWWTRFATSVVVPRIAQAGG